MGVLDGLKSRADAINAERVAQDEARAGRTDRRPAWLPDDWPDGVPYVSLAASYAGMKITPQVDGVTHTAIDPDAPASSQPLSDAQREGYAVEAAFARRYLSGGEA